MLLQLSFFNARSDSATRLPVLVRRLRKNSLGLIRFLRKFNELSYEIGANGLKTQEVHYNRMLPYYERHGEEWVAESDFSAVEHKAKK